MNTLRRWIGYDTIKLIVALLLLALLVILFYQIPAAGKPAVAGAATEQPSQTAALPTPTLTPQPTKTPVEPTPTTLPPTQTPVEPTPTTPPPTPEPTATSTPPAAPVAKQPAPVDCPLAAPARLAVGQQALVITSLNLRKEAGMDQPILLVSPPNSRVEVTGGPVCLPYQGGAYLWWNVKTQAGAAGWSAEASLSKQSYFLQPAGQ